MRELEYYENLRFDVADYSINSFRWDMEAVWGIPWEDFDVVEVSKQELRDYIQTGEFSGANSFFVGKMFDFNVNPPDLSYDPARLELWVGGYVGDIIVIYVWSP